MQTPASPFSFAFGRRVGTPFTVPTASGETIQVTPESLVLRIHTGYWGAVWNWPLAVSVTRAGRVERKAIIDVTRLVIWALGAVMALSWLLFTRKNKPS